MTRRISLPGADELFRKTTLSAVPDQVVEEVEVAHTNRPTTQSVAKAAPKSTGVRQTPRRRKKTNIPKRKNINKHAKKPKSKTN